MLRIQNLAQVNEGIDRWIEDCEELADAAFRGLCAQVFSYVLRGTPEWTGNLAASWKLNVGAPAIGYSDTVFKDVMLGGVALNPEPFSRVRPNEAAIVYATQIAKQELAAVRLGAPVYITNNAPYAGEVENDQNKSGKSFVRLVNLPVEMVHAAYDKFSSIRLTTAKALELAKATL